MLCLVWSRKPCSWTLSVRYNAYLMPYPKRPRHTYIVNDFGVLGLGHLDHQGQTKTCVKDCPWMLASEAADGARG